jgi:hypothetical protein
MPGGQRADAEQSAGATSAQRDLEPRSTSTSDKPRRGLVYLHESSQCTHGGQSTFTWENVPTEPNYYVTAYWHVNDAGTVKTVYAVNKMKLNSASGTLSRSTPSGANEWYWQVYKGSIPTTPFDPETAMLDSHNLELRQH